MNFRNVAKFARFFPPHCQVVPPIQGCPWPKFKGWRLVSTLWVETKGWRHNVKGWRQKGGDTQKIGWRQKGGDKQTKGWRQANKRGET